MRYSKYCKKFIVSILCVLISMIGVLTVYAENDPEAAKSELTNYVVGEMASNNYALEGGGSVNGTSLFELDDDTNTYDLDEGQFNRLTKSAQTEVVSDIADASYAAVEDETECSNVSEETVQNWWKELQAKDGVGTQFLSVILENAKPDFVAANKIFRPLSGPIGVLIGLVAIAGVTLLGLVMAADIFYITIPPVRLFVDDAQSGGGGKGKVAISKLFSHDAIYAVRTAESDNSDGSRKQALWLYLSGRVPMLVLLGICLLYLVSGRIYTLVAWILNLVSGFI